MRRRGRGRWRQAHAARAQTESAGGKRTLREADSARPPFQPEEGATGPSASDDRWFSERPASDERASSDAARMTPDLCLTLPLTHNTKIARSSSTRALLAFLLESAQYFEACDVCAVSVASKATRRVDGGARDALQHSSMARMKPADQSEQTEGEPKSLDEKLFLSRYPSSPLDDIDAHLATTSRLRPLRACATSATSAVGTGGAGRRACGARGSQ